MRRESLVMLEIIFEALATQVGGEDRRNNLWDMSKDLYGKRSCYRRCCDEIGTAMRL